MIRYLQDKLRKFRLTVIVLIVTLAALSFTSAASEEAQIEGFTGHLDRDVPEMMDHYGIPGASIGIIEAGELRWAGFYGYADIEEGREITENTYFRLESISKSVTAWGIMKLVEDGRVDLDKSITEYIAKRSFPESRFPYDSITTRHLLTHTSGMPLGDFLDRYSPEGEVPSLRESLRTKAMPTAEPGEGFIYSNTGYNILELLVEEVTGMDFAAYMKETVLIPLGMENSTFKWEEIPEGLVPVGYDIGGDPVENYVYPEKASGGMFATLEDVAAFMIAGMGETYVSGNDVLTPRSLDQLYITAVEKIGVYGLMFDGYGMGYYLEDLSNGQRSVANGGQGGGVMTYFHYVPETGEGIVILTNSQRSWPFFGRIVDDWARWKGYEGAGFGKTLMAENILWTLTGILFAVFLIRLYMLTRGLAAGELRLSPLAPRSRPNRIPIVLISVVTMMGLMWAANQDYLFLTAVFPIVSTWLGAAMLLLSIENLFLVFSNED